MSKLILIPTPIAEDSLDDITGFTKSSILHLRHFVVENLRTARRVLRKYSYTANFDTEVQFYEYDKHSTLPSLHDIERWFGQGFDVGLMSEAGMPCIADPGNDVVHLAHKLDIEILALSGPSSILLALVASGLSGQNFAFNGYLPIEAKDKEKKLKLWNRNSLQIKAEIKEFRNSRIARSTKIIIVPPMTHQRKEYRKIANKSSGLDIGNRGKGAKYNVKVRQ